MTVGQTVVYMPGKRRRGLKIEPELGKIVKVDQDQITVQFKYTRKRIRKTCLKPV
jgi:hypothetical protein